MPEQDPVAARSPAITEIRDRLRVTWGPDFIRVRRLVHELEAPVPHPLAELIHTTGLSHRAISGLVRELHPWLDCAAAGITVAEPHRDLLREIFDVRNGLPQLPDDGLTTAVESHPALRELASILAAAPRGDRHLDHVAATPVSVLKRALFLNAGYQLDGSDILFLGDHDCTSLALALIRPELLIRVVDVDQRVLAFIADTAAAHGWRLRVAAADLRVELPPSLAQGSALVFTDPPYTPEGIRLFLARAVQALSSCAYARILMAYGFGEAQTGLGFQVQSVVHELRLVMEAILPRFSMYAGAQAIGSASALYICRTTRRTQAAAAAVRPVERIYTHGNSATEAAVENVPAPLMEAIRQHLQRWPATPVDWVGSGWPEGVPGERTVIGLAGFLHTMFHGAGKPPFTREPHSGTLVISLYPHFASSLLPVVLTCAAQRLIIVAHQAGFETLFGPRTPWELRTLLATVYRTDAENTVRRGAVAVMFLERLPSAAGQDDLDFLLRYMVDRRRARLGNAWREGLIAAAGRRHVPLTKNQARALIQATGFATEQLQNYLRELPRTLIASLVTAARDSLAAVHAAPNPAVRNHMP